LPTVIYNTPAMTATCKLTARTNGTVTLRINLNFFSGIMIHFPREAASLNVNSNHIQHRDDNYSQITSGLILRKALSPDFRFSYVNSAKWSGSILLPKIAQ
jgi:hypothetical protein